MLSGIFTFALLLTNSINFAALLPRSLDLVEEAFYLRAACTAGRPLHGSYLEIKQLSEYSPVFAVLNPAAQAPEQFSLNKGLLSCTKSSKSAYLYYGNTYGHLAFGDLSYKDSDFAIEKIEIGNSLTYELKAAFCAQEMEGGLFSVNYVFNETDVSNEACIPIDLVVSLEFSLDF
ncbi:hypothetical protein NEOLI_003110 [Neolecta irregularis DAH-3]|uniref:Uncharacterized protein n=1 Tax=Neolecta irregularis (strain DAH-3) TaxID=1198029 RepID=A0A1U7LRE6_NEOID|nr:hypothetical protein NEOLI_003110 [Neolecta irregularis DAH-3]|eukprot:OLL25199.1 hypothetical protein NEOLI_003110 [Neolecta irregularis DAH-3]